MYIDLHKSNGNSQMFVWTLFLSAYIFHVMPFVPIYTIIILKLRLVFLKLRLEHILKLC